MPKKTFFALLIAAALIYCATCLHDFFCNPIVKKGTVTAIKILPNQSAQTVIASLYRAKIIKHPKIFQGLSDLLGDQHALRYGEYAIEYPLTEFQLMRHMQYGTGLVQHRLTIVNGWTINQVRATLLGDINFNQTLTNKPNAFILQKLGATENHLEGLLYPDTYFFTWGNTDFSVLQTAYQKMQTVLQKNWKNRAAHLPYQNAYQALIVASLIEKETSVDAEKPLIAGVILNRLRKHMRLQIDSSVQYGVDQIFGGALTQKELDTNTPYNTYLNGGLPPTPICMPSNSSLVAALHPATTDYLYYVATGSGGHFFSNTYAEHLVQVAAYRHTMNLKKSDNHDKK